GAVGRVALGLVDVVQRVQRRPQLQADPSRGTEQLLVLHAGVALDRTGLGMRLREDRVGLPLGLVTELVRGALRRDERRPNELLELLVAGDVALELLEAVGEVGPLAPDVLEA